MDVAALLVELFVRVPPLARLAVDGVDEARLTERPGPDANPIAWLVWHLARIQDSHVAEAFDTSQIWVTGDWAARFGLEPDPSNTGFGHTSEEVATIRPSTPDALLDYLDAVHTRTVTMLAVLTPADLDRIVDQRWDPPVTLGVRLVSVADDCLQHCGQAAYVRGLLGY